MTTLAQQMTAEELWRMPDDGFCSELIKGELKQLFYSGILHGRISINISTSLGQHIKKNHLGTVCATGTGFQITSNPDTVRAPDTAFIRKERVQSVGDIAGYFPGAPDLAVEVVSPSDVYTQVEEKVMDWLEAGCKMVIVVNPSKRVVTVFRSQTNIVALTDNETLQTGDVVPGWSIAVKDIFD